MIFPLRILFDSQDQIVKHVAVTCFIVNKLTNQDNNFYLISLSILITCLLDNVWIDRETLRVNQNWELKVNLLGIAPPYTPPNNICPQFSPR